METRPLTKEEKQPHKKDNISGDEEWNRPEDTKETTEGCRIRLFSEIKDERIGDWVIDVESYEAEN